MVWSLCMSSMYRCPDSSIRRASRRHSVKTVCADKVKSNLPGLVFYDLPGQLGFGSETRSSSGMPAYHNGRGYCTNPREGTAGRRSGNCSRRYSTKQIRRLAIAHFSLFPQYCLPIRRSYPLSYSSRFHLDQGGELRLGRASLTSRATRSINWRALQLDSVMKCCIWW